VLATCFPYLDHVIKTVEGTNGAHDNDLRDNYSSFLLKFDKDLPTVSKNINLKLALSKALTFI